MTAYGILLVDTSWANNDSVEIDKATEMRHKDRLVEGTKALIYVRAPVDAVVAEAEVTGDIVETDGTPPDPAFNPAIPANLRSERVIDRIETEAAPPAAATGVQNVANTLHVPLKLVRLKGQTEPIPLSRLRALFGSDFSVFDETWIPLSRTQYDAILAAWKKGKSS